jgi:hypothetical protein
MSPNVTDSPEKRMDVHNNACLTPRGREAMVRAIVDDGLTNAEAARRFADFVMSVNASGHVEASFRINISSQVTGIVTEVQLRMVSRSRPATS